MRLPLAVFGLALAPAARSVRGSVPLEAPRRPRQGGTP